MRAVLVLGWVVMVGCTGTQEPEVPESLPIPRGFPEPVIPEDNPYSAAKAELGRYLFYDPQLSGNGEQSCSSCHLQERAFTDGKVTPVGSTGDEVVRNSPTLVNVAYNSTLNWANPILTELENQILVPMFGEDPVELGIGGNEAAVIDRFASDPDYVARFEAAFPDEEDPVQFDRMVDALATFSRTMISGNSPFDRFTYQGELDALTDSQRRGLVIFFSEELECHHCHGGFNFTEATTHAGSVFEAELFHNTGLYDIDGEGGYPANNTGLFEFTADPQDMGRFRAPTLRNIAVTAPYMHDGSMETLEEVIRHYEAGGRMIEEGPYAGDGRANPNKSGLVAGFTLTDDNRADLLAFLESLTDDVFLTDPALANPFE
ncbi:MAG: MbnH family di-heme enzyme [Myxococcota bacterium]